MFTGKAIDYSEQLIRNDGFWPDVPVADFERRTAQPADLDRQTIAAALLSAISQVNLQLDAHRAGLQVLGYACSAAVPGPAIEPGRNALTEHYLAAVYARARAELLPAAASVTERQVANRVAESEPGTRESWLGISQQLVRVIKGKRRVGAALL